MEPDPSAAVYPNARDIVVYAATDGKKTVLIPASRLFPAGAEKPLEIEAYLVA